MKAAIFAIILSFLYFILAFFNLLASIHGPDSLPFFTFIYLLIALGVLWAGWGLLRKKPAVNLMLIFLIPWGIVSLLGGLFLWRIAMKFDEQIFSSRSSQIKVSKVQDAWYYSKRRNPIGIKISFNLEVPTKG